MKFAWNGNQSSRPRAERCRKAGKRSLKGNQDQLTDQDRGTLAAATVATTLTAPTLAVITIAKPRLAEAETALARVLSYEEQLRHWWWSGELAPQRRGVKCGERACEDGESASTSIADGGSRVADALPVATKEASIGISVADKIHKIR